MYRVLRIAYCVWILATCVKHNIISVIFNDTVQDNISRGLAESMIMAVLDTCWVFPRIIEYVPPHSGRKESSRQTLALVTKHGSLRYCGVKLYSECLSFRIVSLSTGSARNLVGKAEIRSFGMTEEDDPTIPQRAQNIWRTTCECNESTRLSKLFSANH